MPTYLHLDGLAKRFGAAPVLVDFSLEVERGEIVALLGPSGSGKTTALRILAGFESADSGRITIDGETVTTVPPAKRRFGMVFQHYALFPHLSVAENVAFGLDRRADAAARVREVLALVDLTGFEARPVTALSGGQQQRVALARALAPGPRVLLLDEPLSNLDPSLRERTRRGLAETVRRLGMTTILVTHEQEEAFDLGDRVALLNQGRLQQVGTPEQLYQAPANRFVATFVGRATVLPGRLAREGNQAVIELVAGEARVSWAGSAAEALGETGAPIEVAVRPEALAFSAPRAARALRGKVVARRYAGALTFYSVALEGLGQEIELLAPADAARPGEVAWVAPTGLGPTPRLFPRYSAGPAERGGRA